MFRWSIVSILVFLLLVHHLLIDNYLEVQPEYASKVVADYRTRGNFFLHKSFPIFYKETGEKSCKNDVPLILMLHGFPTSSYDFEPLIHTLLRSVQAKIVTFDFLGFGLSAKPNAYQHHYSIHDQADLTEELLQHVNKCNMQVHILAHDYGVSVAQELLARSSFKIASCVFLNGGLFAELHRPVLMQKLLRAPILGALLAHFGTNYWTFKKSFTKVFGKQTHPTEEELRTYWAFIQHNQGHKLSHTLLHYMSDRKEHNKRWSAPILHNPGIPLAFINGPADPVSGQHLVDYLQQSKVSNVTVLEKHIGHYPQLEDTANVAKYYLQFLNQVGVH